MEFYLISFLLATLIFLSAEDSSPLGNPVLPKPRGLHSSAVIKKDLLVIYGGIDGGASDPYKATGLSDLFVFNLTSKLWYQPTIKNAPTQGYKFSAGSNYNNTSTLYVFTGTTSPLLTLDANNWEWTSTPGPGPAESSNIVGGTLISSGNNLIAYGGVQLNSDGTPNHSKVSDQVQVYDLASRKWMTMPNGNRAYFHSSCVAPGQSEALSFGGASTNGEVANSLISLSTSGFQFYLNRPSSQTPPPLIGASLSCIGSTGVLFGGGSTDWKPTNSMVQVINNTGGPNPIFAWSQPSVKNGDNSPGARIGHSAATFGDDIYVYGGVGEKDTNVYKLNTLDWSWDVLKPSSGSGSDSNSGSLDKNGNNKHTSFKNSGISSIIIIAIVSALFGILMMGIIVAVCLRHWRQKNGNKSPSIIVNSSTPVRARAWSENKNDSLRYSSYSVTQSHSCEVVPTCSQSNSSDLRNIQSAEEDNECWTETNGSILSGQDDTGSVKPVKYVHPMSPITSPISSNRTLLGPNSTSSPRSFNSPDITSNWAEPSVLRTFPFSNLNNFGFQALRSNSDIISPLDRIAHLQPSLNNSRNTPNFSKLSSPTSSIQNWPLTSDSLREPSLPLVSSPLPSPVTNSLLLPNLDPNLQKALSEKYRFLTSSLTQLRGKVSLIQATELVTLNPVAIVLFQDRQHWAKEAEMLQILQGPYAPKLKEVFVISSYRDYFILVQERLGTSLSDILCRQTQPFSKGDLRVLIKGIAQVLQFCHTNGVILADLQLADFAFAPDNSSRLMLCRTESCLIEGDAYQHNHPPRYCPPEIASAFLNGSDPWPCAVPAIDNWGLGCLIYELYARQPIFGSQRSEVETLQFLAQPCLSLDLEVSSEYWVDGELRLPGMDTLPKEVIQAVKSLLNYFPNKRYTAGQILISPLLARCPDQFSLLASLPHPIPQCCQTGELDHQLASSIVALRRQVIATSEVKVPRLVMVLPTKKAAHTWKDPATWDGDTFLVYFLCEGPPGLHFTTQSGTPLADPHRFLTRTGSFIAIIAQLCVLYLSPDLLADLDPNSLQAILATSNDPAVFFHDLAQLLERYSSRVNDSVIADSARELEAARHPETLEVWLGDWITCARSVLTAIRHLALQEVREFIASLPNSHLTYTRPTVVPSTTSSHHPRWLAWLCSAHSSISSPSVQD